MSDPPPPAPSAAALVRSDPSLYKRLFGYLLSRHGDADLAADIAGDVMVVVLDGEKYPWDGDKPILQHLGSIANSLVANRARKASTRRERLKKSDEDDDPDKPDSRPSPRTFAAVDAQQERREALARELLAHLEQKEDHIAAGSLRMTEQGIHSAEKQAVALKCEPKDIYRARERVRHHREVLVEQAKKRGEWP